MSSMFCSLIYRCKNKDWCARDFNPKSDEPGCFEALTNADKIRAMSDEDIASLLKDLCCIAKFGGDLKCIGNCGKCWLNWLKEEAAE